MITDINSVVNLSANDQVELNIKYKIKAYADCYGETSVDYEIIDRYYD